MKIILAIVSGLITAASFPMVFGEFKLPNLGFLAWFSLVPLFYAIRGVSPRKAFLLTYITTFIYLSISLSWLYVALTTYGHINPYLSVVLLILLIALLSAYSSFAVMFAKWVEQKTSLSAFWTLPLFFVVAEFLRNYTPFNGFPWGNITNSQYKYLHLIQIVDVVGIYGLTYIMIAFNCWVSSVVVLSCWRSGASTSWCQHLPAMPAARRWQAGVKTPERTTFTLALIVITLAYGFYRIQDIEKKQDAASSIRVAILQGNIPQAEKWHEGLEESQLEPHAEYVRQLKNVDLIVWPEASYPYPVEKNELSLSKERLGLTEDNKAFSLIGALLWEDDKGRPRLWNSALLVDSDGNIVDHYSKKHLVPFGEYVPYKDLFSAVFPEKLVGLVGDLVPGSRTTPIFTDKYQLAPLICYEDIFPEIGRSLISNGAHFLAVITNDAWYGRSSAAFQHLAISVFRSVEGRRWMVRGANTGISAVVDATGRIISKTEIFERGLIVSQVKLLNNMSIYVKYKDLFAWVCVGLVVVFMIVAAIKGKGLI